MLPEQYTTLNYSDKSGKYEIDSNIKPKITSSDLIGEKADRYFFTCGAEAEYVVNYDSTVDGGNVSVFKSDQACLFANI